MTDSMQGADDVLPLLPASDQIAPIAPSSAQAKGAAAARNRAKTAYIPRIKSRNSITPRRATPKKPRLSSATKISPESVEEPGLASRSEDIHPFFPSQTVLGARVIPSTVGKEFSGEISVLPKSFLSVPSDEMALTTTNPSSPGILTARDSASSTTGQDFDVEDLCRKKGLKRVLAVIQDDENTETEVEKIPEALLTKEAMAQIFEQGKKLVTSIERLQRFFNNMKEKLYRARCNGMDQGIEDVMRGMSPFLEQHMQKINKSYQEELTKAKELQELRIKSINLEYETAVRAIWDSVELELERKQRVQKVKIVEKMIKSECDFMHGQLRHACTRWKDGLNKGGPAPKTINGIAINTGTEASIEESAADLWKLMKLSIRQKYYDKYLSPEAESRSADRERAARSQLIRKILFDGQTESELEAKGRRSDPPKNSTVAKNGAKKKKVSAKGATKSDTNALNTVVEEFQEHILRLDMLADGNDLPGVQISIPESMSDGERNTSSAELF